MGHQKVTGRLLLELLASVVMLGARFVLWWCTVLLEVLGPTMIATLIVLAFINNPFAHENGLEIAAFFTISCGLILAWLWIIVRPFVNAFLPYERTIGDFVADWVTGLAKGGRRQ